MMFGAPTKKVEKWLNQKWLNKILGFKQDGFYLIELKGFIPFTWWGDKYKES